MKFCPYCGVSLPGDAVSFCPECGKSLLLKNTASTQAQKKRSPRQWPKQKLKQPPKRTPRHNPIDPMDVNYDGYYDDIKPVDAETRGEGMDPVLIKRVGFVILGAAGTITLAVILMMLL